jgi:hypothetical protein
LKIFRHNAWCDDRPDDEDYSGFARGLLGQGTSKSMMEK